jgi:hypothetical protein
VEQTSRQSDQNKVWNLIKDARTALLVTIGENDALQARPMGCLQTSFDGTLWFLTFRHSSKLHQVGRDDRVLVAYINPEKYEYVAVAGRASVVDDRWPSILRDGRHSMIVFLGRACTCALLRMRRINASTLSSLRRDRQAHSLIAVEELRSQKRVTLVPSI